MERLDFASHVGIAGEFRLKGIDDVMSFTPFCREWEGQAGHSSDALHVTAVLADDTEVRLNEAYESAHACSYDKTTTTDATTIGEQVAGLDIKALIFHRDAYVSYQDGGDEDYKEILYLKPPDFKKIRRRVEDHLRKSNDPEIFRLAVLAGVKIY